MVSASRNRGSTACRSSSTSASDGDARPADAAGNRGAVSPSVDLAAYRIVQEALTNARRHAHGAEVDVELRYDARILHLSVRDDGPGPAPGSSAGNGLIGMRERARRSAGSCGPGPPTREASWSRRRSRSRNLDGDHRRAERRRPRDDPRGRGRRPGGRAVQLRALLETQDDLEVVGTPATAPKPSTCRERRPGRGLMDVRMPAMDGLEAARRVVGESDHGTRVLMLTTFDLDEYVYEALAAGASGFLLKDATAEALLEAVRVVARGDALLAPSVTRRLIGEFARLNPAVPLRPDRLRELTPRETEVLRLVADGLSNAEIAERLVVSEETVKTREPRLQKLGLRDRAQAVVVAYESGLVAPRTVA